MKTRFAPVVVMMLMTPMGSVFANDDVTSRVLAWLQVNCGVLPPYQGTVVSDAVLKKVLLERGVVTDKDAALPVNVMMWGGMAQQLQQSKKCSVPENELRAEATATLVPTTPEKPMAMALAPAIAVPLPVLVEPRVEVVRTDDAPVVVVASLQTQVVKLPEQPKQLLTLEPKTPAKIAKAPLRVKPMAVAATVLKPVSAKLVVAAVLRRAVAKPMPRVSAYTGVRKGWVAKAPEMGM
ncbi:MAG: hypothetical protein WAZ18_01085 [Alphaproteobacteria bacterium]